MQTETFYRVLPTAEHISAWESGHRNSYHNSYPGEWKQLYNSGVRDLDQFPLLQPEGKFTEEARKNFLHIFPKYASGGDWTREDLMAVSQLDGVCAFRNADSIQKYAGSEPTALVIFKGFWVSDIPESSFGYSGVLAQPVEVGKIIGIKAKKPIQDTP